MEPISATFITALVGLYTAYTTYKVGMAQAEAQGKPAPTKTEDVEKGKQVAQVVEQGIGTYGDENAQSDLTSYQRTPDVPRRQDNLVATLHELAQREPVFAQQLQDVAKQTNVAQTGGVRGEAHVHGTNSGINIGANTGSVSQNNQTINNQASNRGAQGTFHGPVNFGKDNE
jgi:hypothetical protein